MGRDDETVSKADRQDLAIEIQGLHKRLGDRDILCGVDIGVQRSHTLVIIGGSGTGKSVTLKHIMGLMSPDQGRVLVNGEVVDVANPQVLAGIRRKLGVLFQNAALLNWLSVEDNVALPLRELTDMAEPEIRERVDGLLEALEIKHARRLLPAEISGGMRKRAGLARALVLEPDVILYDEPTSGLDPVVSAMVNEMIVATQRRYGVTSIVVTHDMTSAYQIADRIAMLYKGRIIFHGTPEEIKATSDSVVRQFIEGRTGGPIGEAETFSEEDSEVAQSSAPADEAGSASGDDESARKEVESGQREKGQP